MVKVRSGVSNMSLAHEKEDEKRGRRFLIVCSRPELVQYAINDVIVRESPRLGDEFEFIVFEAPSLTGRQEESKIAHTGSEVPAMMILQSILNTALTGKKAPEIDFSIDLDAIVRALKQLGFEVKVIRHDLTKVNFENIMLSVYRAIKEATLKGKDVVVNLSCCDNVTAIAAFTATMLAMKKWGGRVKLMDVRSELEPMRVFSPIVPPTSVRLKETARKVVELLSNVERAPLSTIAKALGVSKATVSRAVSELERHRIVTSHFEGRIKQVEKGPLFELAELII